MKKWIVFMLTCMMTVSMAMTASAAAEKIDKVSLAFSYDKAPENGDELGAVYAKTDSDKFKVDHVEYINEVDVWSVGDRPIVRVDLSAKDGYRFSYTSSKYFSLSGGNAAFKRAKIYDDGDTLELQVYLKRIGGRLADVENLEWDDTTATWDEMNGAKSYEVRLYRDDKLVETRKTSNNYYDFSGKFTREGCYTFKVRAIAKYDDRTGEWSDYSEDNYVDEYDAKRGGRYSGWVHNGWGWWYSYENGGYPVNRWEWIDNAWYYFNGSGYMTTGWQFINNRWYYMNQSGVMLTGWQLINGRWYYLEPSGAMLTGWQFVNGRWYYLEPSGAMLTGWQDINGRRYYLEPSGAMLNGWQLINGRWYFMEPSGAMLNGWQNINEKWYYFDPSGAMYSNTQTPDGHYVDASGVRIDW